MYLAPNNRHVPTVKGCELCGFMKPDFRDEENMDRNSLELHGTAGSGGSSTYSTYSPTFPQQEPRRYENHARPFNVRVDIGPVWMQDEIKWLFPEARNPGKFPCWISRIIGSSCWTESRVWRTLKVVEGLNLHCGHYGVCQAILSDNAVVEYSAKGKDEWSYKPTWCEEGQI